MDTEPSTKTIRVSHQTHTAVHRLADDIKGTAEDALRHLMGQTTIRVPVSDGQRERWSAAAAAAGVSLEEFIVMRVEAAVQFGCDQNVVRQIHQMCMSLVHHTGARPVKPSTGPVLNQSTSSPIVDK
jgi:uncharacterized protein (UPF0210 family)